VSSPPRDKSATWRSIGFHCREQDWSKPVVLAKIHNRGLRARFVFDDGRVQEAQPADWRKSHVRDSLNIHDSTTRIVLGVTDLAIDVQTVGVEVLPADAEESPKADAVPTPTPAPVSEADLRKTILAIKDEHPDGPPDEKDLLTEVANRLGRPVARNRVRTARREMAPEWVNRVGRPRKSAQ
jgi:hypothetical protein